MFDGRYRPRQTQTPAPAAHTGRIVTDTQYDARGLGVKQSTFYNASPPAATLVTFSDTNVKTQTRFIFDPLERTTATQTWSGNAMKWQATTAFYGDRTMVTPPAGGTPTTTIVDAHGRATELRHHLDGTVTGPFQSTRYQYDKLDRLTKVTDAAGNEWLTGYDKGGRVTSNKDPDKGTTTFTFNPAGDLLAMVDARNITLAYDYDELGRKTSLWQGAVDTGTKRAEWTYDTADGVTALGQLIKSTRYEAGRAYSSRVTGFDDAYRPLGTSVSLPPEEGALAGPWTTTMTYHVDGSPATITHPAAGSLPAETVHFGYDARGYPVSLTGLETYISNINYYTWGAAAETNLGTSATNRRIKLTTSIDEATRRLTEARISTESQASPGQWVPRVVEKYGYDDVGNVKSINEVDPTNLTTTVSNQCFTYDGLRQLTEAWTTSVGTCQANPTQAVVGGPDPYWSSYRHNTVGNRTAETIHAPGGDTTRTYTYPASGSTSIRPHALTQVSITGASTGTDSYAYDQAGNATTRNIAGRPGQSLTWDAEGHLASVSDSGSTASYIYTPGGQRLLSYEPGGVTTLYLNGQELRRTATGVTCTRFYGEVAVRTTTNGLQWQAPDHHGTSSATINPATQAITRRRTDPYGNPRGTQPTWPTNRGFVNGTNDSTGLTHLGAREYDPRTGRFVSVDPIMDDTDPVQMNGYAYANNNPTTGSDPDGLVSCVRLDDQSGPCASNAEAVRKYTGTTPSSGGSNKTHVATVIVETQVYKELAPGKKIKAGTVVTRYSFYVVDGNVVREQDDCSRFDTRGNPEVGPAICGGSGSVTLGKQARCQQGNMVPVCYAGADGYVYDIVGNVSCAPQGVKGPCLREMLAAANQNTRSTGPFMGPAPARPSPSIGPSPTDFHTFVAVGGCAPFFCFGVTAEKGGLWANIGQAMTFPGPYLQIGSQTAKMDDTAALSGAACVGFGIGLCGLGGDRSVGRGRYGGGAVVVGIGHVTGGFVTYSTKFYSW